MRKSVISVVAALALCAGSLALGTATAGAAPGQVTVSGSRPSWATPAARSVDAPAGQRIAFRVYLRLRNQAAMDATAQAVSSPGNAAYHHYLTPAQVKDAYDPTDASVASVKAWLTSQNLSVTGTPANNLYVSATGSVAQVNRAFGVDLGLYSVKGQQLRSPDRELSVPASLASVVSGVVGVDQSGNLLKPDHIAADPTSAAPASASAGTSSGASPQAVTPSSAAGASKVPQPDGFRNATPCSAYWGEQVDTSDPGFTKTGPHLNYAPCGYTPPQLRQAYGIDTLVKQGLDGRSTTIAIVDAYASPSIYKDASTYATRNDPTHPLTKSQFSQLIFKPTVSLEGDDQCGANGWWGEETLDVEAAHAMAPGAHILFVGGSDCTDQSLDVALNAVVAGNLAQIVSNSYGDAGEAVSGDEVAAFDSISESAVLQGIGVYFSSGDDGDEVADLGGAPTPDFSATNPWVTAVGGTTVGIDHNGKAVLTTSWETGKSTLSHKKWIPAPPGNYLYGSGGGTSRLYTQPFYQRGVVPDSLSTQNQTVAGVKGRVVPDISMDGDPNTGMLIGETQTFPDGVYYDQYRIGGTSLSSPLFAGFVALADDLVGIHHGFINPSMYANIAGTAGIADVLPLSGQGDVRVDYVNGVDATDGLVRSLRSFDDTAGLAIHTTPGYDDTTGLGTPNGLQFLLRL